MSEAALSKKLALLERSQIMTNNSIQALIQAMSANVANNTPITANVSAASVRTTKLKRKEAMRLIEKQWNKKYVI